MMTIDAVNQLAHKVFGEPVALLAGDALFNLGYEVIVNSEIPKDTKIKSLKKFLTL